MKNFKQGLVIASTLIFVATASAADKKIARSALPPAVEKTVAANSAGAEIKGFATEVENGKLQYEAQMVVNGRTKDLAIDKNGVLLEVEEEVAFDSLPDAVKKSLTARAGAGTVGKVESLTKKGKLVAYEAVVIKGGKKSEVQVGPAGEKLAHEE